MNEPRRANSREDLNPGGSWTSREAYLLALVCLLVGAALGYFFRGSASTIPAPAAQVAPGGSAQPASGMPPAPSAPLTVEALAPLAAPLLAAVKTDSNNADALVQLGNLYYDHKLYSEAIPWYARALELRPKDVNVRTDLGTAYWYSGDAKKAIAEYNKSLAVDPAHSATLLNVGIVKLNGLNDPAGAIAAWEKLLKLNPQFPEKQKVLDLIAQAQAARRK
jgi:cytochrome c-type biogenesis protein CcmH/NrfG